MKRNGIRKLCLSVGLLFALSACAQTAPKDGFGPPPPTFQKKANLDKSYTPDKFHEKVADNLVGTNWTGEVSIRNCKNAPTNYKVIRHLSAVNLLLVRVTGECLVMNGNYSGNVMLDGKVGVGDEHEVRQIKADFSADPASGKLAESATITFFVMDRRGGGFKVVDEWSSLFTKVN